MYHPSALPPHMRRGRPPAIRRGLPNRGGRGANVRDFSASKWSDYFTQKLDIQLDNGDTFRVYLNQDESTNHQLPLLLLLHGGGYSSMTWSVFVKAVVDLCHVRILAIDVRGHGSTETSNDEDLSLDTITGDISNILLKMFRSDSMPEIILMGHSMGGALAAHFVDRCTVEAISEAIIGLIVIDVVEGTAKEALSHMQQILRARPSSFKSIEYAIEWYVRSGQTRNVEAAKISMPGQIKHQISGICATDLEQNTPSCPDGDELPQHETNKFGLSTLNESSATMADEQMKPPELPSAQKLQPYIWRIDLSRTEPYWVEWFDNLSKVFLSSKGGAKLLLLAGVDRLDGPMTIGQMQGKFQMQVLPRVGHIIHEDDPDSVAQVVAGYLVRNRFSTAKENYVTPPMPSC